MEKRQTIFTETIKDQIYQILKEEIMNCTIKSGEKLVEQAIADRLRVSRSPVREAIKQLTGDGLVENIPNRGAFVKKPTEKEMEDMYSVRLMFEVYAAKRACRVLSKADERQLRRLEKSIQKAYQSGDIKGYHTLERELSNVLIALSGNHIIISTYGNLYTMMSNFGGMVLEGSSCLFQETVGDRLALIQALLDRDAAAAEVVITQHLDRAWDMIHGIIQRKQKE